MGASTFVHGIGSYFSMDSTMVDGAVVDGLTEDGTEIENALVEREV